MKYLEKITDKVYAHTKGETIGNVGVIAGDTGNYIIDTSMYPVVARDLRTEMENINSGNILGAILTHYHFDHSGGNQEFHNIHAHKHVMENMKNNYNQEDIEKNMMEREDKELFEGLKITYPTKLFETNPYNPDDSEVIEVINVGGHTNGSSLIFYNEEDALFAGDNLFAGYFPWGGDPTASPYAWLDSTNLILERKPGIIIPGHGDVQYNLKEIEKLKEYLETLISKGEKLVSEDVDKEKAIETLSDIESNPERREGMKERTLDHWYDVIKNK